MNDTEDAKSGRPPKYTDNERKEKYKEVRRKYYAANADKINEKRRLDRQQRSKKQ